MANSKKFWMGGDHLELSYEPPNPYYPATYTLTKEVSKGFWLLMIETSYRREIINYISNIYSKK